MADPRTRTSTLRYFIARVLFFSIDPHGKSATATLLPVGTYGCLANMSFEGFNGKHEGKSDPSTYHDPCAVLQRLIYGYYRL